MRFILTFFFALCMINFLNAQISKSKQERRDSLKEQLQQDSSYIFRPKISRPYLRVENRYSFISKEPVNLVGFLAGAAFYNRHIFCAGYYTLNRRTQKSIEVTDENNKTRREYLILNYFIFSYQYILLNRRFLQINVPFEVGYGLYSTKTTDRLNNYLQKSNGKIIPASGGLQFIIKPIKWVGVSCVGGYRHVVQKENIDLNFKGFYYSFGLWIDARHVIRHTKYYFKKKEYSKNMAALI